MVMKATPTAALVVAEAEFLFEFEIVVFDAPAQFGEMDEMLERCVGVDIGEPDLGRFGFTVRPFGEHGQLWPWLVAPIVPLRGCGDPAPHKVGRADAGMREARHEFAFRAFAPDDVLPGFRRKLHGPGPGLDGLMIRITAQVRGRPAHSCRVLPRPGFGRQWPLAVY